MSLRICLGFFWTYLLQKFDKKVRVVRFIVDLSWKSVGTIDVPQAYFLGIFKKLKAKKTQPLKNSRPFFAEKLNMSGFFEALYKKLNANDFNKYTLPRADGIK